MILRSVSLLSIRTGLDKHLCSPLRTLTARRWADQVCHLVTNGFPLVHSFSHGPGLVPATYRCKNNQIESVNYISEKRQGGCGGWLRGFPLSPSLSMCHIDGRVSMIGRGGERVLREWWGVSLFLNPSCLFFIPPLCPFEGPHIKHDGIFSYQYIIQRFRITLQKFFIK